MHKTILAATIALALLLGTAGITVAAAQNSQPGEPLYAVRTWSEQIQQNRTMQQVNRQLQSQQSESSVPLQTHDQIQLQTQYMQNEQFRLQIQDRTAEQRSLREEQRIQQPEVFAPQNQGDGNPWTIGTPTPGSGYGPGSGTCVDCACTPQAQNGSGGQGLVNPGGHGGKP